MFEYSINIDNLLSDISLYKDCLYFDIFGNEKEGELFVCTSIYNCFVSKHDNRIHEGRVSLNKNQCFCSIQFKDLIIQSILYMIDIKHTNIIKVLENTYYCKKIVFSHDLSNYTAELYCSAVSANPINYEIYKLL